MAEQTHEERTVDLENAELMKFASADCEALAKNVGGNPIAVLKRIGLAPLKIFAYLLLLPFWRHGITLAEAREIREIALRKKFPRWAIGVCPYYFINWMLWHLQKHVRGLHLDVEDGKHAWAIAKELWKNTFGGDGRFFLFYGDFRRREYGDFVKRDLSYFMSRNGDIVTESTGDALFCVLSLTAKGNKFMRLAFGWACALVERKLINPGELFKLARVFTEDRGKWMDYIKKIRRETLDRIEKYCENMIRFSLENGDRDGAEKWNAAFCTARELEGFRPMRGDGGNLGELARLTRKLKDEINAAGKRTYILYKEKPCARETITGARPAKSGGPLAPNRVEKYGRFEVADFDGYIIAKDTLRKKRPYKFKKSGKAYGIVMKLLLNHASAQDQTHCSDREWRGAFQKGRGDATRFKEEQIFILPRWDAERKSYTGGQFSNKWRVWMDDELKMSVSARVTAFKTAHPRGH